MNILFGLERTSCVLQDQEEMKKKFEVPVNLEDLCRLRDQVQCVHQMLKGELRIDNLHRAKEILQDILYKKEMPYDWDNND